MLGAIDIGTHKFSDSASLAGDTLNKLGCSQATQYFEEKNRIAVRKPYLHSVNKDELKPIAYSDVFDLIRPQMAALGSIYLHYPFCTKSCAFCHYYKVRAKSDELSQSFPAKLVAELDLLLEAMELNEISSDTIHFGGGTPSLLQRDAWMKFVDDLRRRINFASACEIAIEVDPADLNEENLTFWLMSGINRVSLGVQSFQNTILRQLQRDHNGQDAIRAVRLLQNAVVPNINVDLMYGMPGWTFDDWVRDVETVTALKPNSITCYGTRSDPVHSARKAANFPSATQRILAHQYAIQTILDHGYYQYSPNQFVRDYSGACFAKNNRNRCEAILGLGPRAHSIFEGVFYESAMGVEAYQTTLKAGRLPDLKAAFVDSGKEKVRFVQFGLKLSGLGKPKSDNGVDDRAYRLRFGSSLLEDFSEIISELTAEGLIKEVESDFVNLTHLGVLFADEVVKRFAVGSTQ